MHDTAFEISETFFLTYVANGARVLELGSESFNGSIRDGQVYRSFNYVGCDLRFGEGVDVVTDANADRLPFDNENFDAAVASSVFEHDDFFWDTFLRLCHVVRPGGVIYLNVPSNGWIHRYSVDNWRFYPDAGHALVKWAQRNGQSVTLVESFTVCRRQDVWNDFCAVFCKGSTENIPEGRLNQVHVGDNLYDMNNDDMKNETNLGEDSRIIKQLRQQLALDATDE
jgi:SAM-dependent methyltransferase